MSPVRRKRLMLIILMLSGLGLAAAFIIQAFQQNMMFFFSTTEVSEGLAPIDREFRVGGLVVEESVQRDDGSLKVQFALTDNNTQLAVQYVGVLPDLFREGQGIVAKGRLNDYGYFVASEVLAKHDENYMPAEVAATMHASTKEAY